MKRIICFVSILIVFLLPFSCQKAPYLIMGSAKSLTVKDVASTETILFTTNRDWKATASDNWCKLSPSSGEANEEGVKVTVSCDANTTYDSRTCTISITVEGIVETITISQDSNYGIIVSPSSYELSDKEQNIEIGVSANVVYDCLIEESGKSWINAVETKALSSGKFQFLISHNESYDNRTAEILFKSKDGLFTNKVSITQMQKNAIILSNKEYDVDIAGQTINLTALTNVDINVSIPTEDQNWIQKVETKSLTEVSIAFVVLPADEYSDRTSTITIYGGDVSQTFSIHQYNHAEVVIPDSNFKSYLIKQFDLNGDKKIDYREALKIEEINVYSDDIESLEGIECFRNLKWLTANPKHTYGHGVGVGENWRDCGFTNDEYNGYNTVRIVRGAIKSLDVSKNTELRLLNCSGNYIKSLDLRSNNKLESLSADYNYDLSSILFGETDYLSSISLSATSISSFDVSKMPNLNHLLIDNGEPIGTIDVSKNPLLKTLSVQSRGLTSIDVSKNTKLNLLSCALNKLTSIDISNNPELTILNIGYNNISSIDISNNKKLVHLLAVNCSLSTLDISGLTDLESLSLDNYCDPVSGYPQNTISTIDLSNQQNLTQLGLQRLNIKDINLSGKTKLLNVILFSNNAVEELNVSSCSSLEHLYCPSCPNLKKIYVNSNQTFSCSKDKTAHYYITGEGAPYESTDFSKNGEIKVLQTATEGNGIDIVLMGDAFTDQQISDGTYDNIINQTMEAFFNIEPFHSYRECFNIYSIYTVSRYEGYGAFQDTALGTYFGEGTFVGGDDGTIIQYANLIPGFDGDNTVICVVMNEHAHAGTCVMYKPVLLSESSGLAIAYFPLGNSSEHFEQLVHHEAGGHGFGKLGDEYFYPGSGHITQEKTDLLAQYHSDSWFLNIDTESDPSTIYWSDFLNDSRYDHDGLGIFEGSYLFESGVYRPTEDGIMNTNIGVFNAPSRKIIYKRIGRLAYGSSWAFDYETFVSYDATNITSALASTTAKGRKRAPLSPPVVINKDWRKVKPNKKDVKELSQISTISNQEMVLYNIDGNCLNGARHYNN